MPGVRQYVVMVVAAAIIIAMIEKLSFDLHTKKTIKLVSGLLLSILLLSPIAGINLTNYITYFEEINVDAKDAVIYGEQIYADNMNAIITERCETYILDKANQLGANISVEIQCDMSEVPLPIYAQITGNVSPFARRTIQNIITKELGIPEENQLWI